ncbi:uncharacterized protein CANTADRAFT_4590 [Suhomyces tanzawaensis NRRL Y-17324]|uniref:RRM domain-containing protein n=1 Tax=Suhomyces tanzawaensis NRRL Y-17324 TaxID=984487 RepID=A0A1E4SM11_9ASCO|nr:uncharacterized protein CANTADRAFT_4590 [Suhomyces tanzawaensis NRRL Y-17324]ODV80564.1 hypothetical protein CANTADRAFT_4590 [Suhomyces tanzawaensis NRRL Y-17324]
MTSPDSESISSEGPDTPGLVDEINDALFHDFSHDSTSNTTSFPLVLSIPFNDNSEKARIVELVSEVDPSIGLDLKRLLIIDANFQSDRGLASPPTSEDLQIDLSCTDTNRECLESLIYTLHASHIPYNLDYSNFVSHPGILFIKKLSSNLVNPTDQTGYVLTKDDPEAPQNELFALLQETSHFKSLQEIKIFGDSGSGSGLQSAFAIVKFRVYLDVDIIIAKLNKLTPNPFNHNRNVPLYLNKYLNKKERINHSPLASSPANNGTNGSSSPNSNFDMIVLENLNKLFLDTIVTIDHISKLLDIIKKFGNDFDLIYFPLDSRESDDYPPDLNILEYAFIRFKHGNHLMENTLKILYYLNGLSWEQLLDFDLDSVEPLFLDSAEEPIQSKNGIKITIAQYKHNHYIFRDANNAFVTNQGQRASNNGMQKVVISPPNPGLITAMSAKQVNYQETNIYVNNLPVVFGNNDELWETFWKQFGTIKSAKIINPQFYKHDESVDDDDSRRGKSGYGKIGFVFYTDFKMAIKAILLTNNRLINVNRTSSPILIQSSFALQKSNPTTYANHGNQHSVHRSWSKPKRGLAMSYPLPVAPIPATAPQPGQFFNPYYFPFSPPTSFFQTSPNQQAAIAPFPHPMFGAHPPNIRRKLDEDYDSIPGFYSGLGYGYTYPPPYYFEQYEYDEGE